MRCETGHQLADDWPADMDAQLSLASPISMSARCNESLNIIGFSYRKSETVGENGF